MNSVPDTKRVLVVEDDKDLQDIIRDLLESQHYQVYATEYGETAREILSRHGPDIAVVDLTLPDEDGLDVCEWIQAEPALQDIPIVIISGRVELSDRLAGFLKGAARYLCKPFELEQLAREVYVLAGPSAPPPAGDTGTFQTHRQALGPARGTPPGLRTHRERGRGPAPQYTQHPSGRMPGNPRSRNLGPGPESAGPARRRPHCYGPVSRRRGQCRGGLP